MSAPTKREPAVKARAGRPPGATRDATRGRILTAARRCFAKNGYASTTNRDVGDEAGITAAAIYRYYDSKAALYLATVRDALEEIVPRFRAAVEGEKSPRAGLSALLLASAEVHRRDPSLAAFLSVLAIEMRRHEEIAAGIATEQGEIVALLAELVDRAVRAKELSRAVDPAAVVSMLLACTMGLSLYAAAFDVDDHERAVRAFVALVEGSLFAPRRGR